MGSRGWSPGCLSKSWAIFSFSPLLCLPVSFLLADLNTSLWAEPRLFLKLLLTLRSIIFLLERQDPMESVPKYCPPRGPALALGTLLPPPGSGVCLPGPTTLSVIGRTRTPGSLDASVTGAGVPPHVPRAERRQEGPADLTSPLDRRLTDAASRGPSGSRPGSALAQWEAALDNNSLAVPCPRSQLRMLQAGHFLSVLPLRPLPSYVFRVRFSGQENMLQKLTGPGSAASASMVSVGHNPWGPRTREAVSMAGLVV